MDIPEDLRPVVLPDGTVELRIHGVSGTPPESLIKGYPVRVQGDDTSGFYRVASPTSDDITGAVEGYCWGGMTSRSRLTALWLFLLPFGLVNVAGWTMPPIAGAPNPQDEDSPLVAADAIAEFTEQQQARHERRSLVARLLALMLTLLAGIAAYLVALALVDYEIPSGRALDWFRDIGSNLRSTAGTRLASAAAISGVVILLVFVVSRRSTFRYERFGTEPDLPVEPLPGDDEVEAAGFPPDPGGLELPATAAPPAGFDDLWDKPFFVRALGRMHLGAALGAIALVVSAAWSSATEVDVGIAGAIASGLGGIGVVAAVAGLLGIRWRNSAMTRISSWLSLLGLIGLVVAVAGAIVALEVANAARSAEFVGGVAFAMVLTASLGLVVWLAFTRDDWELGGSRFYAISLASWGFVALAAASSGMHLVLGRPSASIHMAALLFTITGLLVACLFLGVWHPLGSGTPPTKAGRLRQAVESALRWVKWTGVWLAAATLIMLVWYWATVGTRADDTALPEDVTTIGGLLGWALVVGVLAVVLRSWLFWIVTGVAVLGIAMVGVWNWLNDGAIEVGSQLTNLVSGDALASAGRTFLELSGYFAMLLPLAAVGWFVVRASNQHQYRRAVGVVWDLVNFWPRWYHPWAPPPYTEQALPQLRDRIASLANSPGVETVVLSAHSQGAVIAVPVVAQMASAEDEPIVEAELRLLTYGCLLDRHYATLFPRYFNNTNFELVQDFVGVEGWINLQRETDPLGHPIELLAGQSRWASVSEPGIGIPLLTHSDYQYSLEYQASIDDVMGVGPADA